MDTAVVSNSPIKEISRSLDNPTEQEAIAWLGLTYNQKRILCKGAHVSSMYWNSDWDGLFSGDRMEIRKVLDSMAVVVAAFGGSHA